MFFKSKNKKFWAGVPPWVLIGAVAVLLPIVVFITVENINRQKEKSIHLLLEKGAALIRSFEAGTRTGMMGRQWGGFQLQQLLAETAQQPDIIKPEKPLPTVIPTRLEVSMERNWILKKYPAPKPFSGAGSPCPTVKTFLRLIENSYLAGCPGGWG
jgi:hypothetical protein